MANDERNQQPDTGTQAKDEQARRATQRRGDTDPDIEAMGTDGKGTGGVGADAGGYGPVPGSEATG